MTNYPEIKLFMAGTWRDGQPGVPVINPADESVLGTIPNATHRDLDDALAAAEAGLRVWRSTAPNARAQVILRAADLLRQRMEEIATTMTLEQGKPLKQSRLEVLRACEIIEWDAQEGRRTYGRVIPTGPGLQQIVIREPIGVVAAFSPWNFPVSSPARKVAGALSAGCSIILKASEETPAGALQLVQAFADAGLPSGVLNLVFGNPAEVSEHLIASPAVRLVTFTGSVPVGKHLSALAGRHMKPAVMELGGHAPVIICGDADPEASAAASVMAKSRNAGQVCVAPTRFFVHERNYDRFVAASAQAAAALKVGPGLDPDSDLGPLANRRRVEVMEALVADAVACKARLRAGGSRPGNRGYYYPLTVLADVPDEARAMREEPFGPLMLISPVRTMAEALSRANALPFELAAYAFTESADNVAALSSGLECGNLSINHFVASTAETPFGGVKDSGYGREGGTEGLASYTTVKLVSHATRALPHSEWVAADA